MDNRAMFESLMMEEQGTQDGSVCVGDYICLFCEDTGGFMYSDQTSAAYNGLFVYQEQDRFKPKGIPNIHAVTFQILSQNRYKLEKKYRRLASEHNVDTTEDVGIKNNLRQAKLAAEAERDDNTSEQTRLKGTHLKYGQLVQLRHVLTNKYIHTSSTETSTVDKNKMVVQLQTYNAKNAQFRIMPRYKVKVEGELVEVNDRIILESVKSPATYLHASLPYRVNHSMIGSELNLGAEFATLTIMKHLRPSDEEAMYLKGGSVVSLFHKELEAHITAEGIFGDEPVEDVHLRVREINNMDLRTIYNPKSGIVYWQVEAVESILSGNVLSWETHVRLRQMTTRRYLCMREDGQLSLTPDSEDPTTTFALHSLHERPENAVIQFDDDVRIEHIMTGCWLHGNSDTVYESRACENVESNSMEHLRKNRSNLLKLLCHESQQFSDAFTLQQVKEEDVRHFNYVAGMIPFIQDLTEDSPEVVSRYRDPQLQRKTKMKWGANRCGNICSAFNELRNFIVVDDVPVKNRQKLLRNLQIMDVFIAFMGCASQRGSDWENVSTVYRSAYEVIHSYTRGSSKKNARYLAKYFHFFQEQLSKPNGVGLQCSIMLADMIKDNRQIVDRIKTENITIMIDILKDHKHYRYLELLGVLCVCNGIAITENQIFIANNLLQKHKSFMCHIEMGQDISLEKDIIYVSTDSRRTWHPLHKFVYKSNPEYCEQDYLFLESQLELYKLLCYGRNEVGIKTVTRNREFFTWAVAFQGLESHILPDKMRARFCDLVIGLFVDVGDNHSIIELSSNNFVYEEIDADNPNKEDSSHVPKQLESHFPGLRIWLREFFSYNSGLYTNMPGRNLLIKEVLRLVTNLVKYGFLGSKSDMEELMKPVINYVDGAQDAPFPPDRGNTYSPQEVKAVNHFRKHERFNPGPNTDAIVEAKIQGLQLLEMILVKTFNRKIKYLVSVFKNVTLPARRYSTFQKRLQMTMDENFDTSLFWTKKSLRSEVDKLLDRLMKNKDSLVNELPRILFDLTNYQSDRMVTSSLGLLHKFYTMQAEVFAVSTTAQILCSKESKRVHRDAMLTMIELRRLSRTKIDAQALERMCEILNDYKESCHVPHLLDRAHPVGQKILTNNGLTNILYELITQEVDENLPERYKITTTSIQSALITLRFVTQDNFAAQEYNFFNIQKLIQLNICGSELAAVLIETFRGNILKSMQLEPRHIQRCVKLAGQNQDQAPEMLLLLKILVKDDDTGMVLQRNQTLIVKFIMENYKTTAYVMEMTWDRRLQILIGREGDSHQQYLVALIDLLASCAQGTSRYIESLCQTLVSVDEIMCILNNRNIDITHKSCYVRYLVWAYMRTARSKIESGMETFGHGMAIWKHIRIIWTLMRTAVNQSDLKPSLGNTVSLTKRRESIMPEQMPSVDGDDFVAYMLDAGFLLLQTFFHKFFKADPDIYPEELQVLKRLVIVLTPFASLAAENITTAEQHTHVKECLETLFKKAQGSVDTEALTKFHESCKINEVLTAKKKETSNASKKVYNDDEETTINIKLGRFSQNLVKYIEGMNTVAYQTGINTPLARYTEYITDNMDVKLPLGREFQKHVNCFLTNNSDISQRYERAGKLVKQLEISRKLYREVAPEEQENLDVRSLQLLRAMMYNEIVSLPDNWEEDESKHKKQLDAIRKLQMTLHDFGIVENTLNLMVRRNPEISREVLAVIDTFLFNPVPTLQKDLIQFFLSTSEEMFFIFIEGRLALAATVIKERRSVEMQQKQIKNVKESLAEKQKQEANKSQVNINEEMQKWDKKAKKRKRLQPFLQWKMANKLLVLVDSVQMQPMDDDDDDFLLAKTLANSDREENTDILHLYKDTGDINLVMRILARTCDGQNRELQHYLREQHDNIRSVNLVGCITQFISVQYSHITPSSIDLIIQTFSTLNEMCQGNQENRTVILNNKIIDYVNFIMRMDDFGECSVDKGMELRKSMVQLIVSMIEENNPEAHQLAKDICDTIDVMAMRRLLATCYLFENGLKGKLSRKQSVLSKYAGELEDKSVFLNDLKNVDLPNDFRELVDDVAFLTYFALARFDDLKPAMAKQGIGDRCQRIAFRHYKRSCMSIEILKDGHLQKIHFRAEYQCEDRLYKSASDVYRRQILTYKDGPHAEKHLVREETKETMKWGIDRSSPTSKLRELIGWTNDILKDFKYQKSLLSNPVATVLATKWAVWNYACIVLSIIISIIMMVTWEAPFSIVDQVESDEELDPEIYNIKPDVSWEHYEYSLYGLGGVHNFCAFMLLVTYIMLNHPTLPDFLWLFKKLNCCKKKPKDDAAFEEEEVGHVVRESKLEVKMLSGVTFFYVLMFGLSIAGSLFDGYFFAFHLFNIVANNQLLKGVVRAVTQNGMSLLWVSIMGLILIYVYGLVGFAFFRPLFNPDNDMAAYCATLSQCVLSVFRYGTLGDIGEAFSLHEKDRSLFRFGMLTLYQVTFFILFTTIGLNVIFGIIVDTFSELRDLKWSAERDMRESCFICSRDSYDFEQSGRGFRCHVKEDHNMWAYVFYFIHLHETNERDYSSLDKYVAALLKNERMDFFPLNEAMCLKEGKENTVDEKLEEVIQTVMQIHNFQHRKEMKKRQKQQRTRNRSWMEGIRKSSKLSFKSPKIVSTLSKKLARLRQSQDDDPERASVGTSHSTPTHQHPGNRPRIPPSDLDTTRLGTSGPPSDDPNESQI